jgi:hypothetical protein
MNTQTHAMTNIAIIISNGKVIPCLYKIHDAANPMVQRIATINLKIWKNLSSLNLIIFI